MLEGTAVIIDSDQKIQKNEAFGVEDIMIEGQTVRKVYLLFILPLHIIIECSQSRIPFIISCNYKQKFQRDM